MIKTYEGFLSFFRKESLEKTIIKDLYKQYYNKTLSYRDSDVGSGISVYVTSVESLGHTVYVISKNTSSRIQMMIDSSEAKDPQELLDAVSALVSSVVHTNKYFAKKLGITDKEFVDRIEEFDLGCDIYSPCPFDEIRLNDLFDFYKKEFDYIKITNELIHLHQLIEQPKNKI